jgi:predicted GNAT family acetyltransferase
MTERTVRRDDDSGRYELVEDGAIVGYADFRRVDDVIVLPHTVIDPQRRGGGLGAELVQGALDDLRARGDQVVPACWYVADFIQSHPDYQDLLADRRAS